MAVTGLNVWARMSTMYGREEMGGPWPDWVESLGPMYGRNVWVELGLAYGRGGHNVWAGNTGREFPGLPEFSRDN